MKTHQISFIIFFVSMVAVIASVLLAQDSKLPRKQSWKQFLYQDADMIGVGYVYKNNLWRINRLLLLVSPLEISIFPLIV